MGIMKEWRGESPPGRERSGAGERRQAEEDVRNTLETAADRDVINATRRGGEGWRRRGRQEELMAATCKAAWPAKRSGEKGGKDCC